MILLLNGQVMTKEITEQGWPIFRMAFRPFFLFAALFSLIAITAWVLSLTGYIHFSPLHGALFWHSHEMLFGFSSAIISGFLLTAVQNWTGFVTIKGKVLALLLLLWLSARVLLAFELGITAILIMLIDLCFLPIVALCIFIAIFKAKQWRNLFFVPVLLIMSGLNVLMHLSAFGKIDISYLNISYIMVLMVTLIMSIIGGRVFPMFTANGTKTKKVEPIKWLELSSVFSIVACIIVATDLLNLPILLQGLIFVMAGLLNFLRSIRWRVSFKLSLQTPLVSSLHISYWAICLGLLIIGFDKLDLFRLLHFRVTAFSYHSLGLHSITVGGIGLMILSMMSRVSLGHTGRELKLNKWMFFAFIFMLFAFITRVILPFFINDFMIPLYISAGFWVLAYCLFVIVYLPILFKGRKGGGLG